MDRWPTCPTCGIEIKANHHAKWFGGVPCDGGWLLLGYVETTYCSMQCLEAARRQRDVEAPKLLPKVTMLGIPYTIHDIPESRGGTAATILAMAKLAVQGARDPRIIMLARRITAAVPSHDHRGEADAIFRWVKRYVRYRLDSQELEPVNAPWVTPLWAVSFVGESHARAV